MTHPLPQEINRSHRRWRRFQDPEIAPRVEMPSQPEPKRQVRRYYEQLGSGK